MDQLREFSVSIVPNFAGKPCRSTPVPGCIFRMDNFVHHTALRDIKPEKIAFIYFCFLKRKPSFSFFGLLVAQDRWFHFSAEFKTVFGYIFIKTYRIAPVKTCLAEVAVRMIDAGRLKKSLQAEIIKCVEIEELGQLFDRLARSNQLSSG